MIKSLHSELFTEIDISYIDAYGRLMGSSFGVTMSIENMPFSKLETAEIVVRDYIAGKYGYNKKLWIVEGYSSANIKINGEEFSLKPSRKFPDGFDDTGILADIPLIEIDTASFSATLEGKAFKRINSNIKWGIDTILNDFMYLVADEMSKEITDVVKYVIDDDAIVEIKLNRNSINQLHGHNQTIRNMAIVGYYDGGIRIDGCSLRIRGTSTYTETLLGNYIENAIACDPSQMVDNEFNTGDQFFLMKSMTYIPIEGNPFDFDILINSITKEVPGIFQIARGRHGVLVE